MICKNCKYLDTYNHNDYFCSLLSERNSEDNKIAYTVSMNEYCGSELIIKHPEVFGCTLGKVKKN